MLGIVLTIIGFVIIIVVTILAYKTAKDYGRNAAGWALTAFAVVFGLQIILPFFIGVIIGIILIMNGVPPAQLQEKAPIFTISIICMVLSIVAGFLILRHLAKIPEEKPFDKPPAPPSDFNQNS